MNVGIDVAKRMVSLQMGINGGMTTTGHLTPEDALIVAESMKHSAETLIEARVREVEKARDKLDR